MDTLAEVLDAVVQILTVGAVKALSQDPKCSRLGISVQLEIDGLSGAVREARLPRGLVFDPESEAFCLSNTQWKRYKRALLSRDRGRLLGLVEELEQGFDQQPCAVMH